MIQLLYHKVHLATTWQGDEMIWSLHPGQAGKAMFLSSCYHGRGCHNAAKITQRWSDGWACKDEWLQPTQLCDGLPAQTQSSEPVTACDSLWQLRDSWPGWQTPPAASPKSLRRVRPGEVAWQVMARHQMLTGAWCPVHWPGVISREDDLTLSKFEVCLFCLQCFWTYLKWRRGFVKLKFHF